MSLKSRLLAGAALGLLVMGGTGGQAVAGAISLVLPFVDPAPSSDNTAFGFDTLDVSITPIYGLALWRVSASAQVNFGDDDVEGTVMGGGCTTCVVSFFINNNELLFLLSDPIDVGTQGTREPATGFITNLVDCGPATGPGCNTLRVMVGAIGPGSVSGIPGTFTVQAVTILEAIPEPVGLSLFGVGLIALGRAGRRS